MQTLSLFLMGLFTYTLHADPMIFDVRKNLRMADSDPVYHDYYVNGGTELGMAAGMVVTVGRRVPLYDTYQNHAAGDLQLKVARVKIIHTQKGLSVARLQSEFARDNAPLLEDNFIMVGDTLDLATATSGAEGKSADASGNAEGGTAQAQAPAPALPPTNGAANKPVAQISVNSVDLSSQSPSAEKAKLQGVQAPTLQ